MPSRRSTTPSPRLNQRSGTLYENDAISISVEQEYRGSQGRLLVTVHNEYETPTAVVDLALDLDVGGSELRYHVGPLSAAALPAPGDSAAAQVRLECMQPYDEAPSALLGFAIDGRRYQLKIALPSLFTKFLEPVDLAPQVFVQRWATLGAPGLECMQTFAAQAGPANAAFATPRLETLVNLAFVKGVDDNSRHHPFRRAALRHRHRERRRRKNFRRLPRPPRMNEAYRAYRLTVRTAVPRVSESLAPRPSTRSCSALTFSFFFFFFFFFLVMSTSNHCCLHTVITHSLNHSLTVMIINSYLISLPHGERENQPANNKTAPIETATMRR